ncbi:hypothetical protein [Actinopolymorpha pittospori]|uniref:Polymorphic outer membrane protein repeat-containing protein n=1 Tax=Actinopolymorpha pittospori TaxID=648752 RepID=A0A927MN21_9ACTN|nr:hypothetical protein [Actinopolymorpha pittospori]MBE1603266.1 hypothetical protein [Actinopolymorpha pittospori]
MKLSRIRRKRTWFCVTVGGLAGVTGLAAVGVAGGLTGRDATADASAAAQRQARPAAVAQDGKAHGKEEKEVRCDPDRLIAALVHANADGGAVLSLAKKCTYTLTANQDGNGLPLIVQPVAIKGNGATIVRAANADDFRIFEVGSGGNLKLADLTVKGGVGTTTTAGGTGTGGGGLLVQEGGRATVQHATFTFNRSTTTGGAIANYGTTKISGEDQHKTDDKGDQKDGSDKKWTEDDWSEKDASYTSIDSNSAEGTGSDHGGGGLFSSGSLSVKYTRISYNDAVNLDGGGVRVAGGTATLRNAHVDHNRAADDGGGLAVSNGATVTLERSYVTDNSGGDLGGGIFSQASVLYLRQSTVGHNFSADSGGGVFNSDGRLIADRSRINENTTLGNGGGIGNDSGGEAVFRDSEINRNRAIGASSVAGGVSNVLSDLTLTRSTIVENFSTFEPGGALNIAGTVLVDDDSTIIKNRPTNCLGTTTAVPNCFG